jgi:hypothetical protein
MTVFKFFVFPGPFQHLFICPKMSSILLRNSLQSIIFFLLLLLCFSIFFPRRFHGSFPAKAYFSDEVPTVAFFVFSCFQVEDCCATQKNSKEKFCPKKFTLHKIWPLKNSILIKFSLLQIHN